MHVDEYSVGPLDRQSRLELVDHLGILHEQLCGEVIQREDQHAEGVGLRKKCLRNRSGHWGVSGNDPEPLAGGALARAEPAWLRAKLDQLGDGKKVSLLAAPRVGLPAPCVLGRALRLALAGPRVDILPTPVKGRSR